jgi:RNA polymerase sigma-70 factor (sigma-E family)
VDEAEPLRDFIAHRSAAMLRTAYLLVGDRAHAEDLLQTALIKTYLAWPRIRDPGALDAYVRRTMATTAISWWRGRRFHERAAEQLPDRVDDDPVGPRIERDAMWAHLRALPPRQRAVLVLRYYEGLSEAEIAETLGLSRGTVKSHAARALATLRARLATELSIDNDKGVRA